MFLRDEVKDDDQVGGGGGGVRKELFPFCFSWPVMCTDIRSSCPN